MKRQEKIEKKKSLKKIHSNIIEKQLNEVNTIIKKTYLTEEEKYFVRSVIELVENKLKAIDVMNEELTDLIDDTDELHKLFTEDSNFEVKCKANIKKLKSSVSKDIRDFTVVHSTQNDAKSINKTVNLPKLTIKPFDGDTLEWMSFIDSFNAAVHKSNLSDVEKFNYLRGYLSRNAVIITPRRWKY